MPSSPDLPQARLIPKELPDLKPEINPNEAKKVQTAFKECVGLVFKRHKNILETDNPGLIVLIDPDHRGKPVSDQTVAANAQEISTNRHIEVDKEKVKSEESFQKMPEATDAEKAAKQNAIDQEIARRKQLLELQERYEIVHTIIACENATSAQAITDAVTAENKRKLEFTPDVEQEFIAKYKKKFPNAPDEEIQNAIDEEIRRLITERPAAVMTSEQEAEFKRNYVARYKDGQGNYHRIDPQTGEPIADQTVRYEEVYEVITNEAKSIANETDSEGKPTQFAQEIKEYADLLEYSDKDKGFIVRTNKNGSGESEDDESLLGKEESETVNMGWSIVEDILSQIKSEDDLKRIVGTPEMYGLLAFLDAYDSPTALGGFKKYTAAAIYSALNDVRNSILFTDPNNRMLSEGAKQKLIKFLGNDNVRSVMNMHESAFIDDVVGTVMGAISTSDEAGFEKTKKYITRMLADNRGSTIFRDVLVGTRIHVQAGGKPATGNENFIQRAIRKASRLRGEINVDSTLTNMTRDHGITFSPEQRGFIGAIAKHESLYNYVQGQMKNMGIDLDNMGNPQKWAQQFVNRVVERVTTDKEQANPELMILKRKGVLGMIKFKEEMMINLAYGKYAGYGAIIMALFLPNILKGLSSEEENAIAEGGGREGR